MSAAKTRNYPINVVVRARELSNAGWTLRRIGELVYKETGHWPSVNTVAVWVSTEQADKHAARHRARHLATSAAGAGSGGRLGSSRHSAAYQEARARALLQAGMRATQAAVAMDFDFPGQGWTANRVRKAAT